MIGAIAWWKYSHSPEHVPQRITTGSSAGYAGSLSCVECHRGISDTFGKVAMGRSAGPVTPATATEDYSSTAAEFYHEPSRQHFRVVREADHIYQERWQIGLGSQVINKLRVSADYVVGSGNHARTYLHQEPDGRLYQLPVTWYSQEKRWAMSPGYDNPQHLGFSRRVSYKCAFCHAAYPEISPGSDLSDEGEDAFFPKGIASIDCERCHGPAAEHVRLARNKAAPAQIKAAVLNPIHLSPDLQMDVCMQCHLETTSGKLPGHMEVADHPVFAYRPGKPLGSAMLSFDHPRGAGRDDKFEIAGQAYRLRMSECFTATQSRGRDAMTCTTCHDPHRVPADRLAAQLKNCALCHKPIDCTEKPAARQAAQDNCIQCHMPQRRTENAVHVVMTDHFIQRRPPSRDLLAPLQENFAEYRGKVALYHPARLVPADSDLYCGIAQIKDDADIGAGITMLDRYLAGGNSHRFHALVARADGLRKQGFLDRAGEDLNQALRLRPDNPAAAMALADILKQRQQYTEAAALYDRIAKSRPDLARAFIGGGIVKYLTGDLNTAASLLVKARSADPFNEDAALNLALVRFAQDDLTAAERESWTGLSINPASGIGWGALGQILLKRGKTSDAAWAMAQEFRLRPEQPDLYSRLVQLAQSNPELESALLNPETMTIIPLEARVAAAHLALTRGDRSTAARHLAACHDLTTSNPAILQDLTNINAMLNH